MQRKNMSLLLALTMCLCASCGREEISEPPVPEQPPEVVMPEPEPDPIVKTSTATIAAAGDVLMHYPIIKSGYSGGGEYHFDNMFPYFKSYVEGADYAVANLETTLSGLDNGYKYQGYPRFNCPDGIVDSLGRAGFDMLLTANNHSYDTGEAGFLRTLNVIDEAGLGRIGTHLSMEEPRYTVEDINGIKVGMICYTYETEDNDPAIKSLNGILLNENSSPLVNTFSYWKQEEFFAELELHLAAMEREGAQATVLFIHWGNEYQTEENDHQREMAQRICDLGIDVIVGGHPHVVQPVTVLQSRTDPDHTAVCLYSMGNIVSNQRVERMPSYNGYTEDGVFFEMTFAAYSDGTVMLEQVDVLPTWVNLTTGEETGKTAYEIIPLDREVEDWKTAFTLTDGELVRAEASYERTMSIIGTGLEQVRQTLADRSTPADKD